MHLTWITHPEVSQRPVTPDKALPPCFYLFYLKTGSHPQGQGSPSLTAPHAAAGELWKTSYTLCYDSDNPHLLILKSKKHSRIQFLCYAVSTPSQTWFIFPLQGTVTDFSIPGCWKDLTLNLLCYICQKYLKPNRANEGWMDAFERRLCERVQREIKLAGRFCVPKQLENICHKLWSRQMVSPSEILGVLVKKWLRRWP